jgi:hypothetical protein
MPQTLTDCSLPPGNSEGYLEALAVLYADFAQALDAGENWRGATEIPIPDITQGVRGVQLSQLSVASHTLRGWVDFPEI